jgi:F420 biosynthesis protein FbiB-like protein
MKSQSQAFRGLISSRRSIRRFTPEPIPEATLRRLLAAACRAPSAHNRQPWRFVVIGPGEARERLVQRMADCFRADLQTDGLPENQIDRLVRRSEERLLGAPVLILLCLTMEDMGTYPDKERRAAERVMAIQSVALAGGHLLLAAHAEGLGACWTCAPLFVPEVVRRTLDLPSSWEAQGIIMLGRPAEEGRKRARRPVEEVARFV